MEQLTRKCVGFLYVFALSIVNDIWPSISGDKASAESRVKEVEDALAKERTESKKALDDAKNSAALREKDFAERLASLTRDVGGKLSLPLLSPSFCTKGCVKVCVLSDFCRSCWRTAGCRPVE